MENNTCSLSNVVKVIDVLQKNADNCDICDETCTRPFLGNNPTTICFNTRPITLYSCNGEQITTSYGDGTSGIYRVENVDGCCVTCMVLATNPTPEENIPYIKTNTFITFDLKCICAIQCLPDVIVNNV